MQTFVTDTSHFSISVQENILLCFMYSRFVLIGRVARRKTTSRNCHNLTADKLRKKRRSWGPERKMSGK